MNIIKKIKDWLRIFRAQTAAAVILLILIPYLLAGGELFSWYTLVLALWSILLHHISFGQNSVLDAMMGWDQQDPHKKHHPLVSGRIKKETGLKVISIGYLISTILAIVLAYLGPGNPFYSMAFFSLFLVGGFVYNEGFSKISIWDFIPITICFTCLSLFSYFLIAQEFNELIVLVALYIALVEWFQIGIEGEIKEIEIKNEVNMLRILGTKIDGNTFTMHKAIIYPWILKIFGLAVAGYILYKYTFELLTLVFYILGVILALYFCFKITRKRKWNRAKSLKCMGLEEVISIFLLPLILIPIIGILEIIIVLSISFVYFVGMNALLWDTSLAPKI